MSKLVLQNCILTVLLIFYSFHSIAQDITREQAIQVAVANEEMFWRHMSRYYPLTTKQIHQYFEQVDFYSLSANESLQWNSDLIAEFADEWKFDLITNLTVPWNENLLKQYHHKKWFKWYGITQHRTVMISKDFFKEIEREFEGTYGVDCTSHLDSILLQFEWPVYPEKTLLSEFLEERGKKNKPQPESLKILAGDSLKNIPVDTLIKYAEWINWFRISRFSSWNWTAKDIEKIYPFLHEGDLYQNEHTYQILFKRHMNDEFIQLVYEMQFPHDEIRYYFMKQGEDSMGIVPSVDFKEAKMEKFLNRFGISKDLPAKITQLGLVLNGIYEPPLRFADYHEVSNNSFEDLAAIIVSARFKSVLEKSILPPHRYYPVTIHLADLLYGRDTMTYFLLLLQNNASGHILPDSLQIINRKSLFKYPIAPTDTSFGSFYINPKYENFGDSFQKEPGYENIQLMSLYMDSFYDLFTTKWRYIHVSPRLKTALENANISGIEFSPRDYNSSIRIKKEFAPRRKISYSKKLQKRNPLLDQRTIRQYRLSQNERYAILNAPQVMDSINENLPFPIYGADSLKLKKRETTLRELEIKWDVQLPALYRKTLITGKFPSLGFNLRDYTMLSLDRIEQFGMDYSDIHPKMVKGIMIAEDGIGNYLVLLLEPGSTYKIGTMIYKWEHEIGELIPSIDLLSKLK